MIVLGIVVLLTPVVLTKLHNGQRVQEAEDYSTAMQKLDEETKATQLAAAERWNKQLNETEIQDPWTHAPDEKSPEYQEYLHILDVQPVMARLRVPAAGIDLPVYHGSSGQVLAHGAGHVYGSAFPIGGEGTHAALTGHTGISTSTMFDNLNKVQEGDVFSVEVLGKKLAYRVDDIHVVLPTDTERLRPVANKDYVTLITCTPYGINTHRLLVRGERLPDDSTEAQLGEFNPNPWQWWMFLAIGTSAVALCYLLWSLIKARKGKTRDTR